MREQLLERTYMLASRLPHLGLGPDLAYLTLTELWGVWRFLRARIEGGKP